MPVGCDFCLLQWVKHDTGHIEADQPLAACSGPGTLVRYLPTYTRHKPQLTTLLRIPLAPSSLKAACFSLLQPRMACLNPLWPGPP